MIKKYIAGACIWVLRKLNVSVMIGFQVKGEITGLTRDVYYYNNNLVNCKVLDWNGDLVNIPAGPFHIQIEIKNP